MNQSGVFRCLMLYGVALTACGGQADDASSLTGIGQPIVRGDETSRFPQVVMLHVQRQTSSTRCSASYIAPRMLLTAAHCIGAGTVPAASYVYFGDDQAPPADTSPGIPAPGEPSDLAGVESFRVHPDYDASVNSPDVAVVYLDRELPFDPLPLMTERLGQRYVGERATIVGWGGSRALVPDISQVEGAGIKRKGQVTLLGSPTVRDFHADDPNPGMLDPAIRAASLKVDGRAPNANGCAGDSGGPLLVKKDGRNYVAGVGYWTGLSCEDYSIFARIDPIRGFVEDAKRGLGREPIAPRLECVDRAEDGTYTAFFGYENDNGISVEIEHSKRNELKADKQNVRPEVFAPGEHPWVFSVDFQKRDKVTYKISPPHAPGRAVTADKNSPRCECAAACDATLAAECAPEGFPFTRKDCVDQCAPFAQLFPGCQSELNAYHHCVSQLSPAEENWICDPDFIPQPILCQDEFIAALACAGYL
jgi:trypsin